jgi:hypothetical protein
VRSANFTAARLPMIGSLTILEVIDGHLDNARAQPACRSSAR